MTKNVDAIRKLFQIEPLHDRTGNLPSLPGIYPDYPAPIVLNGAPGRELAMARWGESSIFEFGMSRAQTACTGRRSRQNAVVYVPLGRPAELVMLRWLE